MNLPNKLTVFRMILVIIMMMVPIVDSLTRNNRRVLKSANFILDIQEGDRINYTVAL